MTIHGHLPPEPHEAVQLPVREAGPEVEGDAPHVRAGHESIAVTIKDVENLTVLTGNR